MIRIACVSCSSLIYISYFQHQFCRNRVTSPRSTRTNFFGGDNAGVPGKIYHYQCSGIKHCQYLDLSLRNVSYTTLNQPALDRISRLHEKYCIASDFDIRKRNATKYVSKTNLKHIRFDFDIQEILCHQRSLFEKDSLYSTNQPVPCSLWTIQKCI